MTQRSAREILDDAARDRIPDHLDLLPRIAAQYERQKGSTMKPLVKIALAVALVLAVLAVVTFTVPPVAVAMRQVLGYVPGLGLVEQGATLRVLSKPVMVEREGVRLIVEKGSSDAQRTILLISVSGLDAVEGSQGCNGAPQLRLANGGTLQAHEGSGVGSDTGYTQRLVFEPLPDKAKDVTLEIPCLLMHDPGKTPEDWEAPLVFEDADNLQVAPVIELPPPPAAAPAETAGPSTAPEAAGEAPPSPYGISLALERVVEEEDGYILMGNISWTDPSLGDYAVNAINASIVDASGDPVSYEEIAPDSSPAQGSKQTYWAFKVNGKQHAWPLTLRTDANVTMALPDQPSFPVDLASPPAPGASQDLDITVEAGGHTVKVLRYDARNDPDGNGVLTFFLQSDPSVIGASIFDTGHPVLGGGGGGAAGKALEPFISSFIYDGALPAGQVQISITALMLYIDGGWTVTWQP